MGKKNFVQNARLVEGKRWYVDFTVEHPNLTEALRSRPDFGLNEIEDLNIRRTVGRIIAESIKKFIVILEVPALVVSDDPQTVSLSDAIKIMRVEKTASHRKDSNKNYKTIADRLLEWSKDNGYASAPLSDFKRPHAKKFKKYLLSMGLSGRTVNNYIGCLVTMWNSLEQSEHEIKVENPFAKMPKERVRKKKRRTYTPEEKYTVVRHIQEHHYWLYRAMLLLYYCGIRRNEMCRLRFGDFDFKTGLIFLSEADTKNYKDRSPTIPKVILDAFTDGIFDKYPKKCYVFGKEWKPNPSEQLNPNRISKTHRRMLDQLVEAGTLNAEDIAGLDFYAWKDTAISTHIHITSPISTRDQVGHATLEQTLVYYHAKKINQEYRDLPDTLHEVPNT